MAALHPELRKALTVYVTKNRKPPPNPLYQHDLPLNQNIDGEMWRIGHYIPWLRAQNAPTRAPNPGGRPRAFPPSARKYNT